MAFVSARIEISSKGMTTKRRQRYGRVSDLASLGVGFGAVKVTVAKRLAWLLACGGLVHQGSAVARTTSWGWQEGICGGLLGARQVVTVVLQAQPHA